MIICPKCKNELNKIDKTFKCLNNHSYDLSKQGYLNLLLNKSFSGDNKIMVDSRNIFLHTNQYDFLLDSINELLLKYNVKSLLDCGCGEGYYTNRLKSNIIYGVDISKDAILKASKEKVKTNSNCEFIVASLYEIPFKESSFDAICNICAPTFKEEFIRVLKDDGLLIKVIPAENHLIELKENLYEKVYLNDEDTHITLEEVESKYVTKKVELNKELIEHLVKMTPYYYKTSKDAIDRLLNIEKLEITYSFKIIIYRK